MNDVLVLAGGPDRERAVSIESAAGVAGALRAAGGVVHELTIDRLTPDALAGAPGGVVWPVLHGRYGEGGPLQDVLDADGRPYVGAGPRAARLAMDKIGAKSFAAGVGLGVLASAIVDPSDDAPPFDPPLIVKPVFEGSTIGLHACRTFADWDAARTDAARALDHGVIYMAEPLVDGREITLGLVELDGRLAPLPFIEIAPAAGLYDFQAKYERTDTRYALDPPLPAGVGPALVERTLALAASLGVRHVARADFIIGPDGRAWFLEINTMPGFTPQSLVPMAARGAGLDLPALASAIVRAAAPGPR